MQLKSLNKWALPSRWLQILLITVLLLGIVLRFVNLSHKPYDTDEVRGVLRASGYTSQEFIDLTYTGAVFSVPELLNYQKPTGERTVGDALQALRGNPEHPPLYYLSMRFWMQLWNATLGSRVWSAVLGVLVLPAAYWFCLELFESPLVGWITMALLAVSPFQLLYAQQARQYSLWVMAIFLACAALLRAMKSNTVKDWGIYGATLALGFYTHLFFVWVGLGHAIYVAMTEELWKRRMSKAIVQYALASIAAIVAFSPWILVFLTSRDRTENTTRWVSSFNTGILNRIEYWVHNLGLIFMDFNQDVNWRNPLPLLFVVLLGYAVYVLCRRTHWKVWVFVMLLIGVTGVAQVVPDLLFGGRRSLLSRYLIPTYVGIQVAVSYLLATQLTNAQLKGWQQRVWQVVLALVLSVGIASCTVSVLAPSWWTKGSSSINPPVGEVVNRSSRPLVVTDASHTFVLSLIHFLKPEVSLQLLPEDEAKRAAIDPIFPKPGLQFSDVFLYFPSQELLEQVQQKSDYQTEVLVGGSKWIQDRNWLYRVTRKG